MIAKVKAFDTLSICLPEQDSDSWLLVGSHNVDVHSSDEEETTNSVAKLFLKATRTPQTQTKQTRQKSTVVRQKTTSKSQRKASCKPSNDPGMVFQTYGFHSLYCIVVSNVDGISDS